MQLQQINGLNAQVDLVSNELIEVRLQRDTAEQKNQELMFEIEGLQEKLDALEKNSFPLSFDDLQPGRVLGDVVDKFTFFPTYAANIAFLDLINFTDGRPEGDGLCENMRRYSFVSMHERKKYNNIQSDDDMSISSDDEESSDDETEQVDIQSKKGRKRMFNWKTEWLIFCFNARCGITQERIAPLFGVKSSTTIHNIIYAWANVLYRALNALFPTPTRSDMLRAYPISVLRKFGHAKIFMLLDATEVFADIASLKTVNAILYSQYKHNSTLKFLDGCDPIGTTWSQAISNGYPGAISDPVVTAICEILKHIPFAAAVEVDKGFLIDNECAEEGLICIRPMKFMKGQQQQSKEDVALTQKVGKTRIPVEQLNGQAKNAAGFFDSTVRIDQIGLADLLFCVTFLLQNFKLPFIQDRD